MLNDVSIFVYQKNLFVKYFSKCKTKVIFLRFVE